MLFAFRKIVIPLTLASFLMVALLGFVAMSYGADGKMQGSCPFFATGVTLCPQDALVVAIHHISAYQSFLNVPVDSAALLLMSVLLFAVFIPLVVTRPLLFSVPARVNRFPHGPPLSARTRKITRWLSLLENSHSMI